MADFYFYFETILKIVTTIITTTNYLYIVDARYIMNKFDFDNIFLKAVYYFSEEIQ